MADYICMILKMVWNNVQFCIFSKFRRHKSGGDYPRISLYLNRMVLSLQIAIHFLEQLRLKIKYFVETFYFQSLHKNTTDNID